MLALAGSKYADDRRGAHVSGTTFASIIFSIRADNIEYYEPKREQRNWERLLFGMQKPKKGLQNYRFLCNYQIAPIDKREKKN